MVLVLHLKGVDHVINKQGAGVHAAGIFTPLKLQALRAGRRTFERGWGRREGACPHHHGWTQGTGADGVHGLDLYATNQNERTREIKTCLICNISSKYVLNLKSGCNLVCLHTDLKQAG